MNTKDTNPKDAVGSRKPPLSTIPLPPLFEVGLAMLEGACKYGRHNYRIAGIRASVYFDAAMRHLASWWEGEDIDPDSGIPHVSKAMACLVILRDAQMRNLVNDDRPPRFNLPGASKWQAQMQSAAEALLARFPEPKAPITIHDMPEEGS